MAAKIMSEEERKRRSDGAKRAKARLKANPIAYAQFKERTAKAVAEQWKDGQITRRENISKSKRAANALMTHEERRAKFGWMNASHVTAERKRDIWEKSLKKWHDTASPEILQDMIARRTESVLRANYKDMVEYDAALPPDHPTNAWALKIPNPFEFDKIFEVA